MDATVAPQPPGHPMVVATPTARSDIVGTEFTLSAWQDLTRLEVKFGTVRLERTSDASAVMVTSDHLAEAGQGVDLTPRPRGEQGLTHRAAGTIPVRPAMDLPAAALTIECWMYNDTAQMNWDGLGLIYRQGVDDKGAGWSRYVGLWGHGVREVQFSLILDGVFYSVDAKSIPLRQWVHVAGTYDGAMMRLFVDGPLESSAPAQRTSGGPDDWLIGSPRVRVAEVRLSDVVRYTADFTPSARLAPDGSARLLLHCDEGAGDRAADASGRGNDALLSGAVWAPGPSPAGRSYSITRAEP